MIKKVNPMAISIALEALLFKADLDLEREFNKWPEDPDGVEVSWVDFKNHYDSLVFSLRASVEGLIGKLPEAEMPEEEPVILEPSTEITTEVARYAGRKGDSKRPVYYFKKRMEDYPSQFTVTISGCGTMIVTNNEGLRLDYDEDYNLVRQSMDSDRSFIRQSLVTTDDRGMVVVGPRSCKSEHCYLDIATVVPAVAAYEEPVSGYNRIDVIKNLRFINNKAFTWLPYTGAAYGQTAKFVWPELGFSLVVPNMSDDHSPRGHSHETYFCGTKNKPSESNGTRASVFGPAGKKASFVEIHYS